MLRFLRNWRERLRFRYFSRVVDYLVRNGVRSAEIKLDEIGNIKVLIDNSVVGHSITHESRWFSTGDKEWGGQTFPSGYMARVPVHSTASPPDVLEDVSYLPGILELFKLGKIGLFSSAELYEEQHRQPIGRFRGYGYYDFSLFSDVSLPSIDGNVISVQTNYRQKSDYARVQRDRIEGYKDPLHIDLVKILGQNKSQDAWHIRTAEVNSCYCFLTMDYKLLRLFKSKQSHPTISSLQTRVMRPADFGKWLGLRMIAPHMFSYHNASFPVRSETSMPSGSRRRRSGYKK